MAAGITFDPDARLQRLLDESVAATFKAFADKKLQSNQLAATLLQLKADEAHVASAHFRGEVGFYPASVVKLFYLVAVHQTMEDGQATDSEELRRAIKDMIVESYNEATHYVVDIITETTSGPELPHKEMAEWVYKRNAINRYFAAVGYNNLNLNQKTWCEGPYGRERVFVGEDFGNRNKLTTDATARLLAEIALHRSVTPARSKEMLAVLERDPFKPSPEPNQANDYIGKAAPQGSKLWSKAGWTSTVRHDAACLELPNGARLVLVIFTSGHSKERQIIPFLADKLFSAQR